MPIKEVWSPKTDPDRHKIGFKPIAQHQKRAVRTAEEDRAASAFGLPTSQPTGRRVWDSHNNCWRYIND